MAPSEIRRKTVAQLRKAFLAMMTPQWDLALIGKPTSEVTKAAKTLLSLQRARLRLGNAQLKDIRDKLKENEEALTEGAEALDKALEKLKKVEDVLNAAASFLKTVGKIIEISR